MKKIGFIGVGIMGKSMVRNLMKAGFEVSIYARTKAKVEDVLQEGALWCNSIGSCAAGKDAVITIVGFPKDVEEVYFAEGNILDSAAAGTYLIDMTTTSPQLAIRIYEKAKKNGQHALDAPVTGGDTGAKNGTLSILAGGEEQDFHACMPLFEAMGKTIVYEGSAGCGQHTKMANQIMIAGALSGVCEAGDNRLHALCDSGIPAPRRNRHTHTLRPVAARRSPTSCQRRRRAACRVRKSVGRSSFGSFIGN